MPLDLPPAPGPVHDTSPAKQLARIATGLQASGGVAERKFLAVGHALERAVAVYATLAAGFESLLAEMHGTPVSDARSDLAAAAGEARALAEVQLADGAALDRLPPLAGAIGGCMKVLSGNMRDVDVLAMNARLTAAGMGVVGGDFLDFAGAIRGAAQRAQSRLAEVNHELAVLNQHLAEARKAVADFTTSHQASLRAVPARLTAALAALEAQDALAAAATVAVGRRLTDTHGQVAAMIVALQLGDITRQRVEHVVDAILLLADHGDHPPVLGCSLSAAHLRDTADELDQEAARIALRLASLAEDAREIGRVSEQTYGGADRAHSHCIAKLEQDVKQTGLLFDQVWHAHGATEARTGSVLEAAHRLVAHVGTLGSIEADIHIMGLNTTLKCGRLGQVGRPLSIIAQALRDCGKQVMANVEAVSGHLQQLVTSTGGLTNTAPAADVPGKPVQSAANMVAARMLAANAQLAHAGHSLVGALDGLQRDSVTASSLLDAAAVDFSVHRELSEGLRAAANALDDLAAQGTDTAPDPATVAILLTQISASYTMARERDVHRRIAPGTGGTTLAEPEPAADALDDMLF